MGQIATWTRLASALLDINFIIALWTTTRLSHQSLVPSTHSQRFLNWNFSIVTSRRFGCLAPLVLQKWSVPTICASYIFNTRCVGFTEITLLAHICFINNNIIHFAVILRRESVASIACLIAILITFWLHLGKRGSKLHPLCDIHIQQNTREFIRNRSASV